MEKKQTIAVTGIPGLAAGYQDALQQLIRENIAWLAKATSEMETRFRQSLQRSINLSETLALSQNQDKVPSIRKNVKMMLYELVSLSGQCDHLADHYIGQNNRHDTQVIQRFRDLVQQYHAEMSGMGNYRNKQK